MKTELAFMLAFCLIAIGLGILIYIYTGISRTIRFDIVGTSANTGDKAWITVNRSDTAEYNIYFAEFKDGNWYIKIPPESK